MRRVTVEEGMACISGGHVASVFKNMEAGVLMLSDLSLFDSDVSHK